MILIFSITLTILLCLLLLSYPCLVYKYMKIFAASYYSCMKNYTSILMPTSHEKLIELLPARNLCNRIMFEMYTLIAEVF